MKLQKILALDLALNCGWATSSPKIKFGTATFRDTRFDGAGIRFLRFEQWLIDNGSDADLVVYEGVMNHSSLDAGHSYGGYLAILLKWSEHTRIPCGAFPVGTIKKFWTGNGAAKKDAMIKEAHRRGFNVSDDNQADALAILHLGMQSYAGLIL